jgi:hypothetical protein
LRCGCCSVYEYYLRLIGISSSLPVTTGIKMIEVWMLFCLVLSFLDTLCQTYIHYIVSTSTLV